jgi:hypothetical protein
MPGKEFFVQFFLSDRAVALSTVMARRNLMLKSGSFDPEIRWSPDSAMWLGLSLKSDVAYLNDYLAATGSERGRGGDLSQQFLKEGRYLEDSLLFISRIFEWPQVQADGLAPLKRIAVRRQARLMIYHFQLLRIAGLRRKDVIRLLIDASTLNPMILLSPNTWFRLFVALTIPSGALEVMRTVVARFRWTWWSLCGKLR